MENIITPKTAARLSRIALASIAAGSTHEETLDAMEDHLFNHPSYIDTPAAKLSDAALAILYREEAASAASEVA